VVDRLLGEHAEDPDLIRARVPLLRECGAPEALAEGLERALALAQRESPAERRVHARELLRLYEGPLALPDRALALVEREVANDPGLRARGLAAARAVGDSARELALLRPLLSGPGERALGPDDLRRLGLALARAGESESAYTVLCRAEAALPRDLEVLAALETLVRKSRDDARLSELLAARFGLESGEARQRIAAEAAAVAARRGDARLELRWLRKLHALEPLTLEGRTRWLALERSAGTPSGRLDALRALRDLAVDPMEQAELEASEGETLVECGQLAEASLCYARALGGKRTPKLAWLRAQSDLLARLGRATERVDLLRQLAQHRDASPEERARYQRERIELPPRIPSCARRPPELRMLIDSDASAARLHSWSACRAAAPYRDLVATPNGVRSPSASTRSPETERPALEREIAERLDARSPPPIRRSPPGSACSFARRTTRRRSRASRSCGARATRRGAPKRSSGWRRPAWRRRAALARRGAPAPQALADARAALEDGEGARAAPRLDAHDLRSSCARTSIATPKRQRRCASCSPRSQARTPQIAGCGWRSSSPPRPRPRAKRSRPRSARSPSRADSLDGCEVRRVFERTRAWSARAICCAKRSRRHRRTRPRPSAPPRASPGTSSATRRSPARRSPPWSRPTRCAPTTASARRSPGGARPARAVARPAPAALAGRSRDRGRLAALRATRSSGSTIRAARECCDAPHASRA
jgi:hypothetical protein